VTTALIGLDWGSTHLRAYRYDSGGQVEDKRAFPHGIRRLPEGGFAEAFAQAVDQWPDVPVLACGMVGSRNGWKEVPYLDTPTGVDRLAGALTRFEAPDGRRIHLVPGLRDPLRPDVMRGEETQVVGALAATPAIGQRGCLLLPGTHSKWVSLREGAVTGFATVMTGELYGVLLQHSILGAQLPESSDDEQAFHGGVVAARDSAAAGALSRVFSARALMLDGVLPPSSVADYLSGLLIGDELRIALAAGWVDPRTPVQMVGEGALCERYLKAAAIFGIDIDTAPDHTTAHGLWRIATAAGLVSPLATA
jgi:2-dehydro-3-deoxygalactonokinase